VLVWLEIHWLYLKLSSKFCWCEWSKIFAALGAVALLPQAKEIEVDLQMVFVGGCIGVVLSVVLALVSVLLLVLWSCPHLSILSSIFMSSSFLSSYSPPSCAFPYFLFVVELCTPACCIIFV
jgi:hypothetical protein